MKTMLIIHNNNIELLMLVMEKLTKIMKEVLIKLIGSTFDSETIIT